MTYAPGFPACNYVERRMAPLSKALADLVIPHDLCGCHLNASEAMFDPELEKKNFKVAGNILSQIWGELVLDGKSVTAEYVENELIIIDGYDEQWV